MSRLPSPAERHHHSLSHLDRGQGCYLEDRGGCVGRLEACHYPLPAQTLKLPRVVEAAGVSADILVADPRNGFMACHRHHHMLDQGFIFLDRDELPVRFKSFEKDYNLEWLTDKVLERRRQYRARAK